MLAAAVLLSLAAIAAFGAPSSGARSHGAGAGHAKKHHSRSAKVRLRVGTKSQAALLKTGRLTLRVTSRAKAKVRLSAVANGRGGLFRKKKVRFKKSKRQKKIVKLALTARGKRQLSSCGAKTVRVKAVYRKRVKRHGKRRVKRAKTVAKKRLKRDAHRCGPHGNDVVLPDPKTTPGCDPIDAAACMLPYPNDYFTKADPSTPTGIRLDFQADKMPKSKAGLSIFSPAYNRNDGYSPNNIIVTKVPGIDTPAAFKANGFVSQLNIGAYDDPDQKIVLIDETTHKRVPIWAELDMVPGTPNPHNGDAVQGTAADRTILIHPAVSLDYGHTYAVALRNLVALGGTPIPPNQVFRDYRDRILTANEQIEQRRPHMESVFSALGKAGIERRDLYLAWDFTVASEQNLTERVVHMRDDAFHQLGDDDLADGKVEGHSPTIHITSQTLLDPCPEDAECGPGQSRYAYKTVAGTIEVPCYMNPPGTAYSATEANIPCASGSRLDYKPGTNIPQQSTDPQTGDPATWQAPFTCTIPRTGPNEPHEKTSGNKAIVFGHGLLQSNRTTVTLANYPGSMNGVTCGTDWLGLTADDLGKFLALMIGSGNLSLFPSLPDRTQQGYIDVLYLARAMAAADGFVTHSEFQDGDGNPIFQVDQNDTGKDLIYYGISLGGINGGATTAIAPDWTRASLAVPGMGFTTLLLRSSQFNRFLPPIFASYPNTLERALGISMLQVLWDRGEPSAYSKDILNGRLGTPPHTVVIQQSFGDHQVTNIQAETLARTLGATLRVPGTGPTPDSPIAQGRIDDLSTIADPAGRYLFTPMDEVHPYWGLHTATSAQFDRPGGLPDTKATMLVTDTGPVRPGADEGHPGMFLGTTAEQDWDIAPVEQTGDVANDGLDPHQPGSTSAATQQYIWPFLLGQGRYDPCGDGGPALDDTTPPPYTVPYSAADPIPCPAAPIDFIGNGL